MAIGDIVLSILLNLIPLVIFSIPIFLFKKGTVKRNLYFRFYVGLCFFFAVYWILPAFLQYEIKPLALTEGEKPQPGMAALYLLLRTINLLTSFFQYPIVILPMIFIISPFVSYIILYLRIRKEPKSEDFELFQEIHYEFYSSPKEMVVKALKKNDWSKEREMFKEFLIILPISLYLLTLVVDIAGLEQTNIYESTTAIGMLLEIFFVYLATFLYGFQLIKASKISFRGKFIGEQIEARFFLSLKQVGTPIAILSLLLFFLQETDSLLFYIYIFAYFLMSAFIFILFLRIFQPISILLLLKIINAQKWRQQRTGNLLKFWINSSMKNHLRLRTGSRQKQQTADSASGKQLSSSSNSAPMTPLHPLRHFKSSQNSSNGTEYLKVTIYAIVAGTLSFIVYMVFGVFSGVFINLIPENTNIMELAATSATPTYVIAMVTEGFLILHSLDLMIRAGILAFTFSRALRTRLHHMVVVGIFGSILILYTILNSLAQFSSMVIPLCFAEKTSWLTGVPVILDVFNSNFQFYTVRTGFLTASFSDNNLLLGIALPFNFLNPFCNYILWGYFLTFLNKHFQVKSIERQKNYVERTTFSIVAPENNPNFSQFLLSFPGTLLQCEKTFTGIKIDEMTSACGHNRFPMVLDTLMGYREMLLKDIPQNLLDDTQFIEWMTKNLKQSHLNLWIPEFSCIFERAQLESMYLLYEDGRNLYHFHFQTPDSPLTSECGDNFDPKYPTKLAPSLISGMFSAITSFVKEATNSADYLRSIDSGDKKVLLEYSEDLPIFGAIFSDRETVQVRSALKRFLKQFGKHHHKLLSHWNGDVSPFKRDDDLVEDIFMEFL
ncbi:MAG: hypothetical protein ACTSVZ_02690 [Promethearchaeota archaeon]